MRYLIWILVAMMAVSCSGPERFKVHGEILDGSSRTMAVRYYGNGALQRGFMAARDGEFEAEFASVDPALVEIFDDNNRLLARFYAKNGDDITLRIDPSNAYLNTIEGTEANRQWCEWMQQNAETLNAAAPEEINRLVDAYITGHPDNVVSALLFASMYDYSVDPFRADSISTLITPEARIPQLTAQFDSRIGFYVNPTAYSNIDSIKYRPKERDTALIFSPAESRASLIVISNETSKRTDSIVPRLRDIYDRHSKTKLQIMDLALFNDTLSWRHVVARDSAKWLQGWLPGGILGEGLYELAIPAVPYYIVADSAGRQLYRGDSYSRADSTIIKLLGDK